MIRPTPTEPTQAPASRGRDFAFLWHAAWAAALVLGGIGLAAGGVVTSGRYVAALAAGAIPAAFGLILTPARDAPSRVLLILVWAQGAAAAGLLTGGAGGPLAAWCLTPLAAAFVLRRPNLVPLGAAASIAAAACSALAAALLASDPPPPEVSRWMGLLALATAAGGVGSAMIVGQAGGGLRELVGASGQLLVSLDERGRVLGLYGHAPKGVASAELLGRDLAAAAGPAGRAAVQDGLRAALRNGWSETGFQPAGDASGWVVATLRRLDDGRIGGALRDGRAQHAREADLVRARETAEAQNAGKSRFLANMSHELRTPLNAIMGFSDIMKQRLFGPLPDRYGEYAELIHESGSHLLELINDVLDMSKIEAERFELAREEFDARDAVSAVLRLMRGQADRAGVHLRGVLPKDPLDADADRRAVKQIVLNLISNALKFTPRDGAVTVTAQAVGAMLEIVVSDTGVGIAAEDVARLGRPYEQAGGVDQRQAGTGLGLSLVRAFAELHGGEMTLESALGEGTSVTVRLPVLVDAKPVQAPAAAE